jgi:hypothetical protein
MVDILIPRTRKLFVDEFMKATGEFLSMKIHFSIVHISSLKMMLPPDLDANTVKPNRLG